MRSNFRRFPVTLFFIITLALCGSTAHSNREPQQSAADKELVTVPVVVNSSVDGHYLMDLRREDFAVYEDGVRQEVTSFATSKDPFHVVLVLDMSNTNAEKMAQIQRAAITFLTALPPADRLKIISFDDELHELSDFTNDRAALTAAIKKTRPGEGAKLYDAFDSALASLWDISGRKAIVIFTDGVDQQSFVHTSDENLRVIDVAGIIVYPIRYNTRAETEAIARRQQNEDDTGVTTIEKGPMVGVPKSNIPHAPSIPQSEPTPVPSRPTAKIGGIIIGPSTPGPYPQDRTNPNQQLPDPPDPNIRRPGQQRTTPPPSTLPRRTDDALGAMMDRLYKQADDYLGQLATHSGGRVLRADTLDALPSPLAEIAQELNTQYTLSYHSTNKARDGAYRKLRVETTRKDATVRSRPGYRAPIG